MAIGADDVVSCRIWQRVKLVHVVNEYIREETVAGDYNFHEAEKIRNFYIFWKFFGIGVKFLEQMQ